MNQVSTKQGQQGRLAPFITMVVLMALIGFITSLNQQFQVPLKGSFIPEGDLQNTLGTFITFAFFFAYLVIGPSAANYLDKNGYKKTLLAGIAILVVSFLLFEFSVIQYERWPVSVAIASSDIPLSYFIFILGSFVSGAGLTYLQSSVNPYLVASNVKGTSAIQRQNIGGTANSIMTTLAPLFVVYVLFGLSSVEDLSTINPSSILLPMGALTVFIFLLYLIVTRLRLPDIENTKSDKGEKLEKSVWHFRHLWMGAIGIFVYVGVEVCIGANLNPYLVGEHGVDPLKAASMVSIYWAGLLVGRFLSSFLSKVSAQLQLGVTAAIATVLVALGMLTSYPWLFVAVGLMHSVMWGAIYSLALEKLGKYTAKGSGLLVMAIVGGAILPFSQGILADIAGSWQWTWLIVIAGELYLLYYAVAGHKVKQSAV